MPFLPGFEYDIFISYAHVDNEAFRPIGSSGQADGWIEQFYKNLNLILAKRFGRMDMVKIWWNNKKLDGSLLYDQSIEEGIKKSAIFICLNSPGYAASVHCKQELDLFYKKAQSEKTGLNIAGRSRILHVLLYNIAVKDWPEPLAGSTGFPFHDAVESADFGDTVDSQSMAFRTQLQNLRDAIWKLLTEFQKEQMQHAIPGNINHLESKDDFTVFLGDVADTLRKPRNRIITELEKKGFKVLTAIPPPGEAKAHELAAKEALQQANLAIHLLDEFPGREIIGEAEMGYPQKQAMLSLDSGKSPMIWVPLETDFSAIDDENYKIFLQNIESGKTASKTYEFVRGSKGTAAQDIIDFAEQLKARQLSQELVKGKVSVLLDTHFNDQMYALDLCKTLIENQIQPFINPQEGDPGKNSNLLGERIMQVKKLIFLYGNVSKEWVMERMSTTLQLIITNNYPIEDFFIFLAPPRKEPDTISLHQKFLKINIIDNSKNQSLDKNILQQFLTDLKKDAS
jgi:hypothetical protein